MRSGHPVPKRSRAFRCLSQLDKLPELSAFIFLATSSHRLGFAAITMAASPSTSASSTSGSSGEALPLSSSKCSLQESDIQDLVERGMLPEKQISGWRCCYGEDFPSEDTNQAVVFKSFYEKGFAL